MKKKFLVLGLSLGLAVVGLSSVYLNSGLKGLNSTVAEDQTYTLTLNDSTWTGDYTGEKKVKDYPLTAYTANGNPIVIKSNDDFTVYGQGGGGWGGFYNGVHSDASFYNETAITGIKKIELSVWWNIFAYGSTNENILNITTAADSSLATDTNKYVIGEAGVVQEKGVKSYTINTLDRPNYFKIDFGGIVSGVNRHSYTVIRSIKITYSCVNVEKDSFNLTAPWWESRAEYTAPGPSGTFTAPTAGGSSVTIVSNAFVEYPNSWGCIFTNGQHWDAEFHNGTALGGILKIEFGMWWDVYNGATNNGEKIVVIYTASDASFTQNVKKSVFKKTAGINEGGTNDSYTLTCDGTASYFKFVFGESSANAHFSGVRSFKVTYAKTAIPTDGFNLTAPWWESRAEYTAPGPSGNFNAPTNNGNSVSIVCNNFVEYPNSWGCIFTNGQHWDAEFHNGTALGGILRIEFGMWWDVINAATNNGEKIVVVYTASDASFTQNVKKSVFAKTAGVNEGGTNDSYVLECDGTASYFKFVFGESSANAHFSGVRSFKVTYLA